MVPLLVHLSDNFVAVYKGKPEVAIFSIPCNELVYIGKINEVLRCFEVMTRVKDHDDRKERRWTPPPRPPMMSSSNTVAERRPML